ncbi:hypothetical protein ACOSP7_004211 [Xanthoceras sorbifolium]
MDNESENDINETNHLTNDSQTKVKVIFTRILAITSFIFEILTIIFEQLLSPHKSHYALIAMVTSFIAMLICTIEIVYKGRQEKVTWRRRGNIWCFKDIFGLISVILQFICTTIAYVFYCRNVVNHINNISISSLVFAFCLLSSKILK